MLSLLAGSGAVGWKITFFWTNSVPGLDYEYEVCGFAMFCPNMPQEWSSRHFFQKPQN